MTRKPTAGAAVLAASLLLVLTSGEVGAHEKHRDRANDASVDAPNQEPPAPASISDARPHDHGSHARAAAPAATQPSLEHRESNLPRPLAWLGTFHPPLTHFPIGLLIAAALGELLFMRTGAVHFDHAVRFAVWLGTMGALGAATLGWLFAGFRLCDEEWLMTAHRWAGTGTALLAAGLLVLCERTNHGATSRQAFRVALFSSAALVGATGFLGGALIHGLDHHAW